MKKPVLFLSKWVHLILIIAGKEAYRKINSKHMENALIGLKELRKWETVVDFTKIKKGGVSLKALLSRITEANGKIFVLAIERRKENTYK